MSTSFKSFKALNDALAETYETRKVASINSALDALSAVVYAAESVASEYAGLYSQVQWMKYSQDGDPSDVTPSQQLSIPDSVISKLKALVSKADAIYDSISSGSEIILPELDYLDMLVDGSVSPVFRIMPNGSIQTGMSQPDRYYQPCGLGQGVAMTRGPGGALIEVVDNSVTPARSRVITDDTYKTRMYEYRFGASSFIIWSVNSFQLNVPILTLIQSSGGTAKLAFLNEDNQSYSYFDVRLATADQSNIPTYVLSQLLNMSGADLTVVGNIDSVTLGPSVDFIGSAVSLNPYGQKTIDNNIEPDTLYHNYSKLKECINGL